MTNTQEYIHRLQFCCRVIKNLNLGELHVMSVEFKPTYQLINKRGVGVYSFSNLEKLERFVEKSMSRRTSLVLADKSINRRLNMRREERLARANGRPYYTLRSAI